MLYGYDIMHLHTEEELKKIKSRNSIVVFFKVLGFSDLILNDYKKAALICHALSKINEQFNNINESNLKEDNIEMYSTTFSNSIILSCPIIKNNRLFIIKEIIRMLCDVQIHMLREGFLIRGGITIGDICHNEKYVFGKAFMEANALESKLAIYPRIIFSDELINIIRADLNESILRNINNYECLLENEYFFAQYIREDDDLVTYIDYLESGLLKFADIMSEDYVDDFKLDFLDKINQYIEVGKENKILAIKKKYLWLEEKFCEKLNYLRDNYNI